MKDSYVTRADADSCAAPNSICGEADPAGARVCARSLMQLLGFDLADSGLLDRASFATRQVREGQVLTHTGDACRTLYIVRSGTFKACMLHPAGAVQGVGFPMAGDTVGVDGLANGHYGSDVTALEASEVVMIPVEHMMQLSRDDSSVATLFHRLIGREIVRDKSVLFLLGSLSAEARVAAFLLDMSDRYATLGHAGSPLSLPMARRDIANYVGLKIETVCRAVSAFAREGILRVERRQVELLDPGRLRKIASDSMDTPRARRSSRLHAVAHEPALAAQRSRRIERKPTAATRAYRRSASTLRHG